MTDETLEAGKCSPEEEERLEALVESFLERYRRGETVEIADYLIKYPLLAHRIRDYFPGLILLERLQAAASGAVEGSAPGSDASASSGGLPERLGEYRIRREIGRGGMGVVYEAEQESLGRRVALKVLPFHHFIDPQLRERFRLEARAAANLQHPNIVPVYGLGEEEGIPYYVSLSLVWVWTE
jgi:hypothetical protein